MENKTKYYILSEIISIMVIVNIFLLLHIFGSTMNLFGIIFIVISFLIILILSIYSIHIIFIKKEKNKTQRLLYSITISILIIFLIFLAGFEINRIINQKEIVHSGMPIEYISPVLNGYYNCTYFGNDTYYCENYLEECACLNTSCTCETRPGAYD